MLVSSHMAWGLVFGLLASKFVKSKASLPYLLVAGAIPDLDLITHALIARAFSTNPYGTLFGHHGIAHSWFALLLLFLGLSLALQRNFIPYCIASLQHVLFGDLITNEVPLVFPLSLEQFGFRLYLNAGSIALELLGFLALLFVSYRVAKEPRAYWTWLSLMTLPLIALTIRDSVSFMGSEGLLFLYAIYGMASSLVVLFLQYRHPLAKIILRHVGERKE